MTTASPAAVTDAPPPYRSHIERTAAAPRDIGLHSVTLSKIDQVNSSIRLFRLRLDDQERGAKFNAGQWLDVFVPSPSIHKPGGFTITSAPYHSFPPQIRARFPIPPDRDPLAVPATDRLKPEDAYIELAVQNSSKNPPAAWLWQDEKQVLGKKLMVRVGGSFIWPPPSMIRTGVAPETVVLVAGGVGINPLISILTHLHLNRKMPPRMHLLYSTKTSTTGTNPAEDDGILFLSRIRAIAAQWPGSQLSVTLFCTPSVSSIASTSQADVPTSPSPPPAAAQTPTNNPVHLERRRVTSDDVKEAMGHDAEARRDTVVYICGPQAMTDEFVEKVNSFEGVREENVLCEKWW